MFDAWQEFRKDKKNKPDIIKFSLNLENNIFELYDKLVNKTWEADKYASFLIKDPKLRHIHKASVRDRVLYHSVYRILYPIFDKTFIFDVYSSRKSKGTHAGVKRLTTLSRKLSKNYTQTIYVLQCDIKKFFDSMDHEILLELLSEQITDGDTISLVKKIIDSFHKTQGKGLPLGNVTSQLFANVYMNPFDWFVKKEIGARNYIRYCDDFLILSTSRDYLFGLIPKIEKFLENNLHLHLHPEKISVSSLKQGIDFLGYVAMPHYSVLRTKTKHRIFRRLKILALENDPELFERAKASYLGIISYCNGLLIKRTINNIIKNIFN